MPEGAAPVGGRRGARLGTHGRRAARRAVGLECALIDHSTITVHALDAADTRSIDVEVAGAAALFVAKAHKLHDRVTSGMLRRIDDKDAGDVVRLMRATRPDDVGATFVMLSHDSVAGPVTLNAIQYLDDLFGRRGRRGIEMAARNLRIGIPDAQVEALCVSYATRLLTAVRRAGAGADASESP